MAEEKRVFEAEVAKLLDIVVNSLYSNKEIFIRELISNASDSCDRLRYAALTDLSLLQDGGSEFAIHIAFDKKARTLIITDNGFGMNHDELVENLGTIAKSGTAEFVKSLSGDDKQDVNLIGQFGVGFYSSFMVAKKVEVLSRKAGETQGWSWTSDGRGKFTVSEADNVTRGAKIILHLRKEADDFLDKQRLQSVVKTYSDHIALPVILDADPDDKDGNPENLNAASALWSRPKNKITKDQYKEFYHHVAHAFDDPWHTLHYRAEGAIEYTSLLFVPSQRPFDLFQAERKAHVKLYVKRVFISDDLEGLLPPYLRFMRGVVDSSDLPLNISREMLQDNPVLKKIRNGLVKRLFKDLKERAKDKDDYASFWDSFGAVFKEGLYEDFERRSDILELSRFRSSTKDGFISLNEYVENMKDGQDTIYYISGESASALKASPQMEAFVAKDIEVLLLTDPIDEFWVPSVGVHKKHPLKSVSQTGTDISSIKEHADTLENKSETAEIDSEDLKAIIEKMKNTYGQTVKDVRVSSKLTNSPVCLITEDGGMSLHMERMLKQHGNTEDMTVPRILEINPNHSLIRQLISDPNDRFEDAAWLLLDQARIVQGESVPDPAAFSRRMSAFMESSLQVRGS